MPDDTDAPIDGQNFVMFPTFDVEMVLRLPEDGRCCHPRLESQVSTDVDIKLVTAQPPLSHRLCLLTFVSPSPSSLQNAVPHPHRPPHRHCRGSARACARAWGGGACSC